MKSLSNQYQTSRSQSLTTGALIAALLVFVVAAPVRADLAANTLKNPKVVPPGSTAYGQTYAQWSEAWLQWAFSLPVTAHPLFDTADCSAGQSGNVWFLGAKFCPSGDTTCNASSATRSCTVPA